MATTPKRTLDERLERGDLGLTSTVDFIKRSAFQRISIRQCFAGTPAGPGVEGVDAGVGPHQILEALGRVGAREEEAELWTAAAFLHRASNHFETLTSKISNLCLNRRMLLPYLAVCFVPSIRLQPHYY